MSRPYRVGINGCSPMAIGSGPRMEQDGQSAPPKSHVDGFADSPSTDVVAVCDLDRGALNRYVAFHGEGAACYTNAGQMLANEALDIVSIVTPDNRHCDVFAEVAQAGVKGILCEKPIATSLTDADKMIDIVRATSVKAVINHTRRFDARHQQVRSDLASGAIGGIHHVTGLLGGSRAMLFRLGTHLVNTMLYFIPAPPVWVQAAYADQDAGYGAGYHGDGGRNPDLEPAAVAIIGFADGTRAVYNASKTIANQFEITVFGETGMVTIGNRGGEWKYEEEDGTMSTRLLEGSRSLGLAIVPAITSLVTLIEHDGDSLPSLMDARTTIAILLAITESASRQGIRVPLDQYHDG